MEVQRMVELDVSTAPPDFDPIEATRELQLAIRDRGFKLGRNVQAHSLRPATSKAMSESVKMNVLSAVMELAELLDGFDWKEWKADALPEATRDVDPDWLKEKMFEAVDVHHFLNNIYIALGMDSETVKAIYHAKWQENMRRQRDGY